MEETVVKYPLGTIIKFSGTLEFVITKCIPGEDNFYQGTATYEEVVHRLSYYEDYIDRNFREIILPKHIDTPIWRMLEGIDE